MMNKEEWKDIAGYENKYQVSNLGRVKSLSYNQKGYEKILKTYTNKRTGYVYAWLYSHCKGKLAPIHRLVAQAFIPNPENKGDVNHKDCDRTNNSLDNLEWCTRSENIKYGFKYGKIKCNFLKKEEKNEDNRFA